MLLLTREKNNKYIEVHTSSKGEEFYCVEVYDCTPKGRICEKSFTVEKDLFNLIAD